jgi:hypothetical protein
MRMHAVLPMLSFALLIGIAALPASACELEQKAPRASVSDTRVWQLAVLPSAEAYCAATPGRRVSVHWFAGVLQSLCSPS